MVRTRHGGLFTESFKRLPLGIIRNRHRKADADYVHPGPGAGGRVTHFNKVQRRQDPLSYRLRGLRSEHRGDAQRKGELETRTLQMTVS